MAGGREVGTGHWPLDTWGGYDAAMVRGTPKRWLLRGSLIVPILICLVGWAWSYGHSDALGYVTATEATVAVGTDRGSLGIALVKPGLYRPAARSWHFRHNVLPASERRILVVGTLCGFYWQTRTIPGGGTMREAAVPYYALLLPLGAALVLVWRRTRPPRPGRAFPVEMAAATKDAS